MGNFKSTFTQLAFLFKAVMSCFYLECFFVYPKHIPNENHDFQWSEQQ